MLSAIETGAAVLGAAGLAAGGYAYAAMWPGSQIFGKTLIAPKKPGELALTFDDGPNPAWTPQLLDVLAEHRVHGAFFMLGKFAAVETELVKRVAEAGHLVGCHSWDHPNLARTAKPAIEEQLRRSKDTLEQVVGQEVRFFRPPYGARRPYALKAARRMGLTPVTWNAMTDDWAEPDAQQIAKRLEEKINRLEKWWGRAANIVLHDGGHRMLGTNRKPSVTAARLLLERYAQTHLFVRLDAWA